ncbi:MAG TPA: GDSL-type esterase/lipase family protein [Acidimicrobiales bacterium]|jgi:lysophospholipase L1-like esterase
MGRRRRSPAVGVAAGIAVLGLLALGVGATARGGGVAGADEPGPYYLAIGASESVGVQPDAADPRGAPTDDGYTDDVTRSEATRRPGLQLVDLGCPGETASAALGGGGPCQYGAGSQVAEALTFLRAHPGATVLATVDLGFNDLRPCLAGRAVDEHCVTTALAEVGQTVTTIVDELDSAGGPTLQVVGIEKYDPYLGAYTAGPDRRTFAEATLPVFGELNTTLANAYTGAGAAVADVPGAFDTADQRPTALAGYGTLPVDVARVCTLTWACADSPFPHNVHPNTDGYEVVADAIGAALDRSA